MEDVIERLREENEPVPVPLELPDEDLLVEIEEELLISLPPEFRAARRKANIVFIATLFTGMGLIYLGKAP